MKTYLPREFLYRYLRIQALLLLAGVPLGIVYTLAKDSAWFLLLPLATVPLAFLTAILVNLLGEGSVNLLSGRGGPARPYPESGLFDDDMNRANLARREKQFETAIAMYEKIAELAPGRPEPFFELAETRRLAGDTARAKDAYIRVATLFEPKLGSENHFVREARIRFREIIGKK